MENVIIAIAVLGVAYFVYKKFFNKKDTAPLALVATDVQGASSQAAVDTADGVFISFKEVQVFPAEGERLTFTFDANKVIDLLNNTGSNELINEEVPVGQYNEIRLIVVDAESFVRVGEVEEPLRTPSGEQSGLKLKKGFRVGEEGADFAIDFNLEKSLVNPKGQEGYLLKPVLSLVDNLPPVGSPE
jgi:hypothetical protein